MRDLADDLLKAKVKTQLFGGDHAPHLGRLVIRDRLGAGAMGTVFLAYDPKLEREVAVKVVRSSSHERVLAEARALAKLAHPNVVAIHDVVEDAGEVHIIMELAHGVSLDRWAHKTTVGDRKSWRDIVRVMRDAGAGLAAAHAAGLVHRDIKPANIIVGADRTLLVDFGLASAAGDDASAGTPSYMAAEVLAGAAATPASDQFSFAVTLYEALHGERPHAGKTREELAASSRLAARAKPRTDLPSWLRAAIARGLAADPQDRFASISDFLAALRDRRRALLFVAAAGALAGIAVAAFLVLRPAQGAACATPTERIAAVWNDANKAAVRTALGSVQWAPTTIDKLGDAVARWTASYDRVCSTRRDQSAALFELRLSCLDRSLARFGALVETLAAPGADDVRRKVILAAPSAIAELPDPTTCETLTAADDLELPTDRAARQRALDISRAIDRAWAHFALAQYAEARDLVAAQRQQLGELAAPGVRAQLLALDAALEARTGTPAKAKQKLDEALAAAAAAHAPSLELDLWSRALRGALFTGDLAKVYEWAPFARAAAARAGREGAEIDGIVAEALRNEGKLTEAKQLLDHALASQDPLRPDRIAILESNLGSVQLAGGDSQAAHDTFQRALDRLRAALGYNHPELAHYMDKLAAAKRARGKLRDALRLHEQSLAIRTAAFGDHDRAIATSLLYRGETQLEAGELTKAQGDLEQALRIRMQVYGTSSARLAEILVALGDVVAARGTPAARTNDSRTDPIDRYRFDTPTQYYEAARTLDPNLELGTRIATDLHFDMTLEIPSRTELLTRERLSLLAATITAPPRYEPDKIDTVGDTTPKELARRFATRYYEGLDPAFTEVIASTAWRVGERGTAIALLTQGLAAAGNEPSRTALALAIGLARTLDGERAKQAARVAISLYQAMPELARGADYDAMLAQSR